MENELESLKRNESENKPEDELIAGAEAQPPQFKLTAKLHNTNSSPYEDKGVNDVGNRFAFGRSADSTDDKNIT